MILQAAVREGMTDVYVALKRLRRTGSQRRAGHRAPPTFDRMWSEVDGFVRRVKGG